MTVCKTLIRTSLFSLQSTPHFHSKLSFSSLAFRPAFHLPRKTCVYPNRIRSRDFGSVQGAVCIEHSGFTEETAEDLTKDTVEQLLKNKGRDEDDVVRLMKMERKSTLSRKGSNERWFPYLDSFKCGEVRLSSGEVLEAVGPYVMEERKERFRNVVKNRSYSVCLVVEGLSDFGNVSAAFRSADALGIQSVHVVSLDSSKRYRSHRHVSMGAEKWLDIELWNSPQECFEALKSRGYRIATTHVGMDAVSVYDMDWSYPTAVVVGNENRGISEEALKLSDMRCSVPMKGMVDSFNVSVAAGILMHQAVCDRTSRLGHHGDLTLEERQILLAEFSLRHSRSAISIAHEYAKRKDSIITSNL